MTARRHFRLVLAVGLAFPAALSIPSGTHAATVGTGPCASEVGTATGVTVVTDGADCVISFKNVGSTTWEVPATVGDDIASLLGPTIPADAPKSTSGAVINEVVPPASKPVTTGLNVRASQRITPAQGLKLLRIKGGKKPSFVVTKRSKSGPCTVTKTRLTTKKNGVCAATITYTTSKGKKATARLVIVITS